VMAWGELGHPTVATVAAGLASINAPLTPLRSLRLPPLPLVIIT
jgi:hypothetical protein